MPAPFVYQMWSGDNQLATAISQESGTAKAVIHLLGSGSPTNPTPPTATDLVDFTAFLTGSVGNLAPANSSLGTGGKINRNLPLVHPYMPQFTVAGVTSIVGACEGGKTTANAITVTGLTPLTPTFDLYPSYLYYVELQKRSYFVLPDTGIPTVSGNYYPPDGSSGIAYVAPFEWARYTEKTLTPLPDTVSATTGALRLRTQSGAAPNNAMSTNSQYAYLQNQRVTFAWYNVPYRFFFTQKIGGVTYRPYLTRFVNTINQYEWAGFPAGSLMFLGATPKPYMPQFPTIDKFPGIDPTQSQSLLCNVQMSFLYTERQVTDAPTPGNAMLTNLNFVPAGHNAFINYADFKFYYSTSDGPVPMTDPTKFAPPFLSFPAELLWCDPMMDQPGGLI